MLINGLRSKFIFQDVIDFDLESLYPSIILAFNIDATTQIGSICFECDEFTPDKFADDMVTHNYIDIGVKYFDLPSVEDFINDEYEVAA